MTEPSRLQQGQLAGLGAVAARKCLVLVDEAPDLELWYAVPEPLANRELRGCRVSVPLRRRKVQGTVISVAPVEGQEGFALRPLATLLHPKPLVPPTLLELAGWMSDYYACRLEVVVRGMIPEMIRTGSAGFKTQKAIRLKKEITVEELEVLRKKAPRQAAILEELKPGATLLLSSLAAQHSSAPQAVKRLEEDGWIEVVDEVQTRDPSRSEQFLASQPLALTDEQAEALRVIELDMEAEPADKRPILLKGVTGSGKTEVYLQAIAKVIDQGQRVIVLVPEISLTPQTTERFKRRFAMIQDQVAIIHSHLSEGERHDEWRKILDGKARITIGARSAIFAPMENVGLIVVDEEHENTYKQENPPRYQGRDVAVVRGRIEGATVLLGSATPSLESWRNTQNGKYQLVELTKRADDQRMPVTRIVDMRSEGRRKDGQKQVATIISEPLRIAIDQRIARGEQTILFLNRRGYSPSVVCQDCGHRVECPHCSVTLTYHEADSRLVCHLCGFQRVPLKKCPECKSGTIFMAGFGTERVEQVLHKVFPRARIARIDTDTMKRKTQLEDTLNDFKAQKYDLLIGTQMIAKGLHFPNVTLVGVLNADLGLHIPDFRAGERTFQLLTQVAGRAGRGHLLGEVLVQTFTPHNPSIQYARHHDFEGFATQELEARRTLNFPPFVHVTLITARSEHERRAQFCAETLHKRLVSDLPQEFLISDPMPSPLVRVANQFRFQVLMRAKNPRRMVAHIRKHLDALTFPEDVIVTVDIDAYNLS